MGLVGERVWMASSPSWYRWFKKGLDLIVTGRRWRISVRNIERGQ